ncbi:hypothetical protein RDWZM_000338 [Blomia tropicalis]|uniref:Lipase domain-containing protein n=1 Tax=Blomia tropicalis TaxID=40697 RepID=A0A9Q0M8L0_BLOTA|nr:hypothetical protein RDWZM_000338 [Blomia tropicalis]
MRGNLSTLVQTISCTFWLFLLTTFVFSIVPDNPRHIEPSFYLYTRRNVKNGEKLEWSNVLNGTKSKLIVSKYFNGKHGTKMIIHGYMDSSKIGRWMHEMKNRFLNRSNLNVILVDWSNGNQFPYGQAVANVPLIGSMVAIQIEALCYTFRTTMDRFHLLGHSLGAHVAGFAGKRFKSNKLAQITGLDAARLMFENESTRKRLWLSDAKFVDVIHTDTKDLFGFGLKEPCGHVDIYPNGGIDQPGCSDRFNSIFTKGLFDGARFVLACDHHRAIDYYIQSIGFDRKKSFTLMAYECADYERFKMGKCNWNNCRGTNAVRCVQIGPRAIEYRKIFLKSRAKNGRNSTGTRMRRFYLTINDKWTFNT